MNPETLLLVLFYAVALDDTSGMKIIPDERPGTSMEHESTTKKANQTIDNLIDNEQEDIEAEINQIKSERDDDKKLLRIRIERIHTQIPMDIVQEFLGKLLAA